MRTTGFIIAFILFIGCGSSANLTTTVNQEWSHSSEQGMVASTDIHEQNGRVFMAYGENLTLLDDASGAPVYSEEAPKSNGLVDALTITIGKSNNDRSDAIIQNVNRGTYLSESGKYLLYMDVDNNREYIGLRSADNGEQIWETETYKWSLERYVEAGDAVAGEIASNIGLGAGIVSSAISKGILQDPPVQRLMVEVSGVNGILLRTLNKGLVMVDAETGEERWNTEEIQGTGIFLAEYSSKDNEIFVAGGPGVGLQELANRTSFEGNVLLCLDARTGKVKWANEYRGIPDMIRGIEFIDDQEMVMLTFQKGFAELIDDTSGKSIVSSWKNYPAVGQEIDQYGTPYTSTPIIAGDRFYAVHSINLKAVGVPDKAITAYNLDDGSESWVSEPVDNQSDIRDLMVIGDKIVARAVGMDRGPISSSRNVVGQAKRRVVAWNINDGSRVWEHVTGDGVSRLFQHQGHLLYGDKKMIYKVDPVSGEVIEEYSFKADENGSLVQLFDTGNQLAALAQHALVFVDKTTGAIDSTLSFGGKAVNFEYDSKQGLLGVTVASGLIPKPEGIHVFDLEGMKQEASIAATFPDTYPVGDTVNGFYISQGGDAIYYFDQNYTLHKHRL